MPKTSFNISEWARADFNDFVAPELIEVADTEIENRAKVPSGLNTAMGIERVMFGNVVGIDNEVGPDGKAVFENASADPRIRFVGSFDSVIGNSGGGAVLREIDDFIEVFFWGTGLNFLSVSDSGARDIRVTVDGGSEGSNTINSTSTILNGREYAPNCISSAASGLALGWHTVKIRSANSTDFRVSGIEIINESNQIDVASGSGFAGTKKQTLGALSSIDYKPATMTGTKGGRVVTYLQDGDLKQAFTEVPNAPAYLGATDHSNEEMFRKINFREFGAGRSDDFTNIDGSGQNLAYTLDDGVTTLVANDGVVSSGNFPWMFPETTNDFISLTFMGTGLDILIGINGTYTSTCTVYVDGDDVGSIVPTIPVGESGIIKLCSGLSYGLHTVTIERNSAGVFFVINDFYLYQPKKPVIPQDALERADYNLMADFIEDSFVGGASALGSRSQGVVGKSPVREMVYSGTWAVGSVSTSRHFGFLVEASATNSFVEYTFFGTGVTAHVLAATAYNDDLTVEINGDSNLSSYTINTGAGVTLSSAGALDTSISNESTTYFTISDMPLGLYTIRITANTATSFFLTGMSVITPIHINDPSLKIGNQSLDAFTLTFPIEEVLKEYTKPDKIQTKFQNSNSSGNGSLPNLTFNNLKPGKWYTLKGPIRFRETGTVDALLAAVIVNHDGSTIFYGSNGQLQDNQQTTVTVNTTFRATGTDITFTKTDFQAGTNVLGTGGKDSTHITLIEHAQDLEETNEF